VRALVEAHAESYEHPDSWSAGTTATASRLGDVEALVMEDNVVEWALGKMKVADEPTAFDDLMGTKG
jgi:trigger factor